MGEKYEVEWDGPRLRAEPVGDALAFLDAIVKGASRDLAVQREAVLRQVAKSLLPKRLRWLLNHPRALKVAYKVRPKWRPSYELVGLSADVLEAMDPAGARQIDGYRVSETFRAY